MLYSGIGLAKKSLEKLIAYQTKNTPRKDYLAHEYWGNYIWCFAGSLIALILLLIIHFIFSVSFWFIPLAFLPILTGYIAGYGKEKRDATGLGNVDKKDIWHTAKPGMLQAFFLVIIIILASLV